MPPPTEAPSWSAPYRVVMALRLLRARKINLISILGVMLGVAAIIVVLAVMDGFQRELRAMIRGSLSDLIVELDTTQELSYAEVKKGIEAVDGVEAVTLQRHTFGLIRSENQTAGGGHDNYMPVRIVGLVPADEARVSRVLDSFDNSDEELPDSPFEVKRWVPDELPRVVISRVTARKLGGPYGMSYTVGERFVLITPEDVMQDGSSEVRFSSHEVIISRIYSTGNVEFDQLHIYVDLSASKDILFPSAEGTLAELRVKLRDYRQAGAMRKDVKRAMIPFDPRFERDAAIERISTWENRRHNLLLAVDNEKFLLAFVLFFIVLVACFTIFATLTMTVVEKTREIGVLRALGATPGGIMSIFLLNGALVGTIGAGLGYGVGLIVANNVEPIRVFLRDAFGWEIFPPDIYLFNEIPTYLDHGAALQFAFGAAISALVFAIIPALRAARLQPVKALRYE